MCVYVCLLACMLCLCVCVACVRIVLFVMICSCKRTKTTALDDSQIGFLYSDPLHSVPEFLDAIPSPYPLEAILVLSLWS